jgi:hypothetical protein
LTTPCDVYEGRRWLEPVKDDQHLTGSTQALKSAPDGR